MIGCSAKRMCYLINISCSHDGVYASSCYVSTSVVLLTHLLVSIVVQLAFRQSSDFIVIPIIISVFLTPATRDWYEEIDALLISYHPQAPLII